MSETRHRTVIEFDVQADGARRTIAELAQAAENLQKVFGGAGQGNAGGASATGAGHAPAAAMGGSGTSPAGASAHAPAAPPGAVAPSAAPGTGHAPSASPGAGAGAGGHAPSAPGGAASGAAGTPTGGMPTGGNGGGAQPPGAGGDAKTAAQLAKEQQDALQRKASFGAAVINGAGGAFQIGMGYQNAMMSAQYSAVTSGSVAAPYTLAASQAQAKAQATEGYAGAAGSLVGGIAGAFFGPIGAMMGSAVGNTAFGALGSYMAGTDKERAAEFQAQAQALQFRTGIAQRKGTLDQQNNLVAMFGGSVSYMGAAGAGFSAEEALGAYGAFGQAAGTSDAFRGQEVLGIARSTASVGAAGSYAGLTGRGAGGFTSNGQPADVSGMIGLAQVQGLRGGKIDQYLGTITSLVQGLATKGLTLDLTATQDFLQRLQATSGTANTGAMQARAAQGLMGVREGAQSKLLEPFAAYGEQLYMANLFRHAGSYDEALAMNEADTSPEAVRKRMIEEAGPEGNKALQRYFRGQYGQSGAAAEALAGELQPGKRTGMRMAETSGLKRAFAQADAGVLGMVGEEDIALAETQGLLQKGVMMYAQKSVEEIAVVIKVLNAINNALGGAPP